MLAKDVVESMIMTAAQFDQLSDEEIDAWVRATAETIYHPVGTCRMGADGDAGAVVDGTLRARGIDRLRVVDASVMPAVPRGNTNAPTIMVAEKAADLTQKAWPSNVVKQEFHCSAIFVIHRTQWGASCRKRPRTKLCRGLNISADAYV